jgi:hypothetical protein
MEIASLIISILTALFAVFTFFFYDRKLKEQDKKINEYQLKKLQEEETDNKKAQIRGNIIKGDRGKRTFKVYNSGKSAARNIRLEGLDDRGISIMNKKLFPYELLNPQDFTELIMILFRDSPDTIKVKYIWDDDYQANNEFVQVLTL